MANNDALRNHSKLFKRVAVGDLPSASRWNQFVNAFNDQFAGVQSPRQAAGAFDVSGKLTTIRRFEIEIIAGDYLTCIPFDGLATATVIINGVEITERINVARPPLLQTSVASHNDVTFDYEDPDNAGEFLTAQRVASADGEEDETQVIVPAYVVGDKIYAMNNIDGDTGVITDSDSSVEWIDLNVDARAWAKQAE